VIENLAYVGFVSPNADPWRSLGPELLGVAREYGTGGLAPNVAA
jgi:hypothetical protein